MRHSPPPPSLEAHVWTAWQAQVAAAVQTPGLLPELMCHRHALLPRFAAYYTQLRGLPRRVRRALQRQWRLPLAGIALMLALGQQPVHAATIPVGGACTLVEAITAANTDTATGGCVAGSGADTIVLPAGSTQTLTSVNNETYGPTGLPVIRSVITIAGNGSTIVRESGAPDFRLFAVNNTGELTLQETTVSGGRLFPGGGSGVANFGGTLAVLNSTISGNVEVKDPEGECEYGSGLGGGVYSSGLCTVTNSTITGNSASLVGGGVGSRGTLTITNSTISGNDACNTGGGVSSYGTLTITNSTIAGNSALVGGGVVSRGTLTITNSTISENFATYGGGVDNGGTLTITNSTISGNSAFRGGGVFSSGTLTVTNSTIAENTADYDGGGVDNGGTLTMTNSTISGNFAGPRYGGVGGTGGGVANSGTLTVLNSTITGNAAAGSPYDPYSGLGGGVANSSTLTLAHTLVSGNTGSTGPEIANSGTVLADNHNLFGVNGDAGVVGFTPGATDIVPPAGVQLADILDPTLAFHGGHTQTHALVPGSPAIDAGGTACTDATGEPLLTDQRGRPRVVDGDGDGTAACDIGAFEFFPLVNDFVTLDPDLDTAFDPTPTPEAPAGTFTITATFTNTSATPLRSPFFTVAELSGDNVLLNAEADTQGIGATLTPDVGDSVLAPGEAVTVDFVLGLQAQAPFTFFVDLFGEPVH